MRCLTMVSVLLACSMWAGIRGLAAAENPAAAEILPPLPTLLPPVDARGTPLLPPPPPRSPLSTDETTVNRGTTRRGPARSCGN